MKNRFLGKSFQIFMMGIGLCLAAGATYSTGKTYQSTLKGVSEMVEPEMVATTDNRQERVRLILPDKGVIGYLADWDLPDYEYGARDQEVEFLLMQYSVAPLVLDRGVYHEIVLGNFNDTGDPQKIQFIQDYFGIQLINTYSNELFVFQGKSK